MAFMFEKLEVYQKAVSLADAIAALTQDFPRGFGFLSVQLSRAALSIAANLAEGNGRFTKPDRKNFFTIARGSVQECVPLLEIARRRGLLDQTKHETLRRGLETIAKMISGLINGLDKRGSPPAIKQVNRGAGEGQSSALTFRSTCFSRQRCADCSRSSIKTAALNAHSARHPACRCATRDGLMDRGSGDRPVEQVST